MTICQASFRLGPAPCTARGPRRRCRGRGAGRGWTVGSCARYGYLPSRRRGIITRREGGPSPPEGVLAFTIASPVPSSRIHIFRFKLQLSQGVQKVTLFDTPAARCPWQQSMLFDSAAPRRCHKLLFDRTLAHARQQLVQATALDVGPGNRRTSKRPLASKRSCT
jgi:hypothetical protein